LQPPPRRPAPTRSLAPHVSAAPQDIAKPADYPGIQHLHFKYGPIKISPGQNTIEAYFGRIHPFMRGSFRVIK